MSATGRRFTGWGRSSVQAALVLLVCSIGSPATAAPLFDEYQVKAAFLLNLARFVEWPADAFSAPAAPLTFCIIGPDPFGGVIDEAFRARQVGGRPVAVKRVRARESPAGCHVAFVGREAARDGLPLRGPDRALLVVGEGKTLVSGGGIALFVENQRVRFEVDVAATDRAGLKVSSRVLALASAVHRRGVAP